MNPFAMNSMPWRPRWTAAAGGAYALLVGVLTLLGYTLDVRRLTDWNDDGISMFPNAAACAALSGAALLFLTMTREGAYRRIVVRLIAGLVGMVGGLTLLEHLASVNLGIDTLLFQSSWGQRAAVAPMRMGPPASSSYLIIGIGLLLATCGPQARRFATALATAVVGIASLPLVGYWFGADHLFGVARFTGIAFQTSSALAALGVGLIALVPESGLAGILRRHDPGGLIVRRLLLPIVAIPLTLGWLRVRGQAAGLFDTAFGTAVLVLSMILMLFVVLWWTAAGLSRQAQLAHAAEAELRASEGRYRSLFEVAVYGVLTIDERGKIGSANPAAERLFGYSSSEMIGRNISLLMPEPYRAEHDAYLENYLHTGVRKIIGIGREVLGRREDGSTFPMDLAVSELQLDGKRHFQGLVHDVSERKRAEAALREADRLKDEFLATLAHELRNPLAPVRNALELLRRAEDDKALIEQARNIMDRQVGQMVRLVDDLLDISRITGGKLQLRKERVELTDVLDSAIETVRPLIEASGHELTVTLPSQPVPFYADPARLAQVFANLLNNAAKYTAKAGHIWLTAERRADRAVVSVRDTGIGIAADHLSDIFDMFSQVAPALERSPGGLGIGLSLVKGLVELHGGTVEARSGGPGKGSEFIVHLPIVDVPIATMESSAGNETIASVARSRILVVDDLRDSADSLATLLQMMGHDTRTAYDGLEAVQAAGAFRPNVVLLDIGLPSMNGYEVAQRIRDEAWSAGASLIALTGFGQEEDKRRAMKAGFDHHLTKPVDPAVLERLLTVILPQ